MQKNTLIQPKGGNGMKSVIDQLIIEAQALAKKQSWVGKGYHELMGRVNERLKEIPRMDEEPISFVIHEWCEEVTGHRHKIQLVLYFSDIYGGGNVHLALEERWKDGTFPVYTPDFDTMRGVGKKLGEAMNYFLEKVRERGIEYDSVTATLTDLAAKLQ